MALTRINEFQAVEGKAAELRSFLESLLPYIRGCQGCSGAELLVADEDPARLVVIERWRSREEHSASVTGFPPEKMGAARELLGAAPRGEFFRAS